MKKTNSKEVKQKIKEYIIESYFDWYNDNIKYQSKKLENFNNISNFFVKKIIIEKGFNRDCVKSIYDYYFLIKRYYNGSFYALFKEWCQGLPSLLNCDYYYNISAVDLLGDWLEETPEEKSKFTESQAEEMITKLLYRELFKNVNLNDIILETLK